MRWFAFAAFFLSGILIQGLGYIPELADKQPYIIYAAWMVGAVLAATYTATWRGHVFKRIRADDKMQIDYLQSMLDIERRNYDTAQRRALYFEGLLNSPSPFNVANVQAYGVRQNGVSS